MPLSHVCIWDSKIGYRRITVEEACEMYPYGVSASSGHFVCELCAQNVLLTAPGVNSRHFRHDPSSPNKECDERQASFDPNYGRSLKPLNSHAIPLHITISGSIFSLQLGFFYPPGSNARCDKIKIAGDSHQLYEHSFERIERIGTTYLNVGTVPSQNYRIEYVNANDELKKYWSNKTRGIDPKGVFFDGRSGQMLQLGGKAYSGSQYYLLQRKPLYSNYYRDIEATEITRTQTSSFYSWYLYQIRIKKFSENSARFFLKYSVFLTEKPTKFYPIWPPYIRDPHFIYHNANEFYFYLCGEDAELKSYPAKASALETESGKLYKLYTREKEQLISLGKSGALGFSYLIKQELKKAAPMPEVTISDAKGNLLIEGVYQKLPKSKLISVSCQYDGKAVVQRKGKIVHVHKLSAEQSLQIDGLSFDTEIHFFQGCDCVRTIRFEQIKPCIDVSTADEVLVAKLKKCDGPIIPVSHAMGAIINRYAGYSKTKQWLYATLRQGEISRKALKVLKNNMPNILGRNNNG